MKKAYIYIIIGVIILVAGGVGLYLTLQNNKGSSNTTTMPNNSNSQSVATNTVTLENFAFSPANITVKAGTTVTWTNKDSVAHTVTETDSQDGPNSGDLSNGASYSFTFKTAGTYHYHCQIHPDMTGTVTVN